MNIYGLVNYYCVIDYFKFIGLSIKIGLKIWVYGLVRKVYMLGLDLVDLGWLVCLYICMYSYVKVS